eukprot:CAMPEP_0197900412 /NCGR_PEP_ID=MMETSP1439-20131203/49025_1 /TAXON_ID=66791 /ORGANISM="Gonyaulax spinifera, Strain CCMP409" /LENGTH=58 /DNA_ID=CAMNT_0043521295 /DNA_START=8 /DNA_END=180 /DNA_ORIENTATION=-
MRFGTWLTGLPLQSLQGGQCSSSRDLPKAVCVLSLSALRAQAAQRSILWWSKGGSHAA